MSKTIDQKVVEMRFDNGQFEKGVAETINSVNSLKKTLDFSGFTSGITAATNSIGRNVESIASRFTTLGVIATTALVNISNQAISTGLALINSLTVDQISAGFEKYSQMAVSTQTIMSATRKAFSSEIDQMTYVSDQLERLLWFTDETSYNFVDMVDSIGKFTAAGLTLDTAVTNIMGIATWAGLSGQNAQVASRAMYQLAQAISKGYIAAQDWMSIETANMATDEFKNLLIDTAVEMGVLKRRIEEDGTVFNYFAKETAHGIEEIEVTAIGLRNTLSEKWLTTDVLSTALDEFGKFPDAVARALDRINDTTAEELYTTEFLEYVKQYKADMQMLTETSEKFGISVSSLRGYITDFNNGVLDIDAVAKKYDISVEDLTKELKKYKNGLLDVNALSKEYGADVSVLIGEIDKLASSEYDLGMASFMASQESRTLEDAINYVKDAVSSGWMTTFNIVIGELLDAKKVFARVSNELYDVFVADGEARNEILEEWAKAGGRDALLEAVINIWENFKDVLFAIKDGFHDIFPKTTSEELLRLTNRFKDFTDKIRLSEEQTEKIRKSVSDIVSVFKTFGDNVRRVAAAIKSAWQKIFPPKTMDQGLDTLNKITEKFKEFVDNNKVTGSQFARLERTFQGLFAILDIISQLIVAILKPLTGFDNTIGGIGDTVLETTAKIGDWLVALDEGLREGEVFDKIRNKIVGFFESIKQGFIDFKNGLDEFVQELSGKSLKEIWDDIKTWAIEAKDKISEFFDRFKGDDSEEGTKKLSLIAQIFKTITEWVRELKASFDEAKPYLDEFMNELGVTFDSEALGFDNFDEMMRKMGAWGTIFGIIFLALHAWEELTYYITDGANLIRNGLANINLIVEGLGEACWNLQKVVKVTVIEQIAASLLVMAIAVAILASIKQDALADAVGGMVAIAAVLGGLFEILMKMNNMLDTATMLAIGKSLKSIGFAILEVAVALAIVATAAKDKDAFYAASNVMISMLGIILLFYGAIDKLGISASKAQKISAALIILGIGMIELSIALAIVAKAGKNPEALKVGAEALAGMLLAVGIFYVAMDKFNISAGKVVGISAAMVLIGIALIAVSAAIAIIVSLDATREQLIDAGEILAGMIVVIGIFYTGMTHLKINAGKVAAISASVILLAVAMVIIASAVAIVGEVGKNGADIVQAGEILAGLLVVIGLFYAGLSVMNVDGGKIIAISAGLILVGIAMMLLANAISIVGNVNPDNLAASLESLVILLAAVGVAIAGLSEIKGNIIEAAFAITLTAAGIVLLAYALKLLAESGSNLDTVVVLGAALLVIIAAGALAEKIAPGMYALAIACAAIGAGALMAGIGMLKFAEGWSIIFAMGEDGVDLLAYAIEKCGELIPGLIAAFVDGLGLLLAAFVNDGSLILDAVTKFFEILIQAGINVLPLLSELLKQVILSAVDSVLDLLPVLIDLITFITKEILRSMTTVTPMITKAALDILLDTLRQLAANAFEITELLTKIALEVLTGTIAALIDEIPRFIDLGWQFVINLIEGIDQGIEAHAEDLVKAIRHLIQTIIDVMCQVLGIHSPSTKFLEIGENMMMGLFNGIREFLGPIIDWLKENAEKMMAIVKDKVNAIKEKFNDFLEATSILWEKVKSWGSGVIEGIKKFFSDIWSDLTDSVFKVINFIREKFEDIKNKVKELGEKALSALEEFTEDWPQAGKDMIWGLINGIGSMAEELWNKVTSVAQGCIDAVTNQFDEHSPSKVFFKIGQYADQGLIDGFEAYSSNVSDASEGVANDAIRSFSSVISKINDSIYDEMDTTPTIRPILDLSEINNGVDTINGMFSNDYSMSLADSNSNKINSKISTQDYVLSNLAGKFKSMEDRETKGMPYAQYITFNVTGDNPREIANEVNYILQQEVERNKAVWAQ